MRIAIFCGASAGVQPLYVEQAKKLSKLLVARGFGIVYGGASIGVMGAVADSALEARGEITGVIPQALMTAEVAHRRVTDMRVVGSMHERKALMEKLSDAFIALPGGFGTLDEFCEIITWRQLGIHAKPCALLNTAGYFNGFMSFIGHGVAEGFIRAPHRDMLILENSPVALAEKIVQALQVPGV